MWFKHLVLICVLIASICGAPNKKPDGKMRPMYMKALTAYKKLEGKKTQQELRAITAIGVVNGAMQTKKMLRQDLVVKVKDLLNSMANLTAPEIFDKIADIEQQIERDNHSVAILAKSLDLASRSITAQDYKNDLKEALKEYHKNRLKPEKFIQLSSNRTDDVNERVDELKTKILDHLKAMDDTISGRVNSTVGYLNKQQRFFKLKGSRTKRSLNNIPIHNINLIHGADGSANYIESQIDVLDNIGIKPVNIERQDVEDDDDDSEFDNSDETPPGGGGGGIAGILASLSGGEGGSDVGALVGALTGVISNLFGPDGLDVDSLIGSGTALIAGLLAGERNFGTVLGEYVGTALDGVSGGGGAANNGKFLGNFLGTVLASLSADPDDDDAALRPDLFVKNMVQSFLKAKSKQDEIIDADGDEHIQWQTKPCPHGSHGSQGSDSFGFIKKVVSGLIGGITGFVLNASLGSVGGLSDGSSAASGASSSHKDEHSGWE